MPVQELSQPRSIGDEQERSTFNDCFNKLLDVQMAYQENIDNLASRKVQRQIDKFKSLSLNLTTKLGSIIDQIEELLALVRTNYAQSQFQGQ